MSVRQEVEQLLIRMTPGEKDQLLQWIMRDLDDAFPGIDSTPEGRTAVAAAHIIPWRYSHNDDPRNGMALCGLHHWTFDEGLVTITPGVPC